MQQELIESPQQRVPLNPLEKPLLPSQHGLHYHDANELGRLHSEGHPSASMRSVLAGGGDSSTGFSANQLDEKLLGLSLSAQTTETAQNPGQRISDYENALTPPTSRQPLGFKVIKRSEPRTDGVQLEDFPNEILTHILSHLHPDSHSAVALVNKRFYALVTTPYAWRMAFLRYFPGHTIIKNNNVKVAGDVRAKSKSETLRSDTRFFPRLTPLATWRSEYLFRTRLIRGLERGKPSSQSGGIGSSGRTKTSRKSSAVLTYNSKLPWLVTNVHAVFTNGKKPPRAIQGTSDLGVGTVSDPTTGKVEKWGLEEPSTFQQLEEVMPNLVPFGLGEGPAAVPNVMDISQPYGLLAGEGFPGGLAFFRGTTETQGRYLTAGSGVVDTYPDIPKIPEMSQGISSVWLAKSSGVPSVTQSMVGILVGSTLGVVTAYSLGWDSSGPRFANGDMTARWVLSPGVPIISLKVDENYNIKRKTAGRIWAVALNALGEVFYLTDTPTTSFDRAQGDDMVKNAWLAGRSVYWHLLEETRRVAQPDELDKNVVRGAYSPRSPSDYLKLSKDQMAAEAREIEKFLLYKPSHFIKVCQGWDMQRKLEVDFASDDGEGAGESVFVFDCGLVEDGPALITRYMRTTGLKSEMNPEQQPETPSLFGPVNGEQQVKPLESQSPKSPPPTPLTPSARPSVPEHDWYSQSLELRNHANAVISATALDNSSQSVLTLAEDSLHVAGKTAVASDSTATEDAPVEIPGRRARYVAVGTTSGAVLVWNGRDQSVAPVIGPIRIIHTPSPEISSLALSSLYLVHGGSDGLVQAWDPMGSTTEPIRTINARSNGRVPRHMMIMNPALAEANYSAAGAIFLDPDPTVLRGIVSFGAFMRYWSYSSTGHTAGRKRRVRHSDIHGRLASRRQGGTSSRHIAAEEAELRREDEQLAKERAHLLKRFGVGALGDLTEEEAMRYAEMISQEAFQQEEQRRTSDSAEASLDTASSFSEATTDTVTPEPSVAAPSPLLTGVPEETDEYEEEIQQAIRLSLLGGVNEPSYSPRGNSSGEYEFSIKYKSKSNKKPKASGSPGSSYNNYLAAVAGSSSQPADEDEDLALAISLSMQEQEPAASGNQDMVEYEEFPALDTEGVGKGKGVQRW